MNRNFNIHTFIGCDSEYDESELVIFGAPYDSTTSYRPGTRFASSAMRNESFGLETFSPYLDKDLTDYKIFDAGDLELGFGNSVLALEKIEKTVAQIVDDDKLPIMIGGEHLVTLGAVRAIGKRYPNLHIIHLDAHADLRSDYLGEKLSHATVMRRCHDLVGNNRIYQFGIRSGDREEFEFMKTRTITQRFNTKGIERLPELIENAPVYFTIDLDVLDPSCFPGTGTPEAGGISFHELLRAIHVVSQLNVIGCDINELSPIYDSTGASTALACKVLRELMLTVLSKEKDVEPTTIRRIPTEIPPIPKVDQPPTINSDNEDATVNSAPESEQDTAPVVEEELSPPVTDFMRATMETEEQSTQDGATTDHEDNSPPVTEFMRTNMEATEKSTEATTKQEDKTPPINKFMQAGTQTTGESSTTSKQEDKTPKAYDFKQASTQTMGESSTTPKQEDKTPKAYDFTQAGKQAAVVRNVAPKQDDTTAPVNKFMQASMQATGQYKGDGTTPPVNKFMRASMQGSNTTPPTKK